MNIDDLNRKIENSDAKINSMKGFEIIAEAMVEKIYSIFGRNMLLTMLYEVGAGPGEKIAARLKQKHGKEQFEIDEALSIILNELKEFYSVKVREIIQEENKIRMIIENRCFLRKPFKNREKLKPGKAFCRINKGYFEKALSSLIGNKIKKVDISFIEDDSEKDVCVEELAFFY